MCIRAAGQVHRKDRTLARLARNRHIAAHHARKLAGDGKAQPRPAVAPRGQGIGLGEVLKQFRLLFGGQADTGIGGQHRLLGLRRINHVTAMANFMLPVPDAGDLVNTSDGAHFVIWKRTHE